MLKKAITLCAVLGVAGCMGGGEQQAAPEYVAFASAADYAQVLDRQLVNGRDERANPDQYIILKSNGTLGGQWDGLPVTGDYKIIDGKFCRNVTIGTRAFEYQCQAWAKDTKANIIQGTRPNGKQFHYTY